MVQSWNSPLPGSNPHNPGNKRDYTVDGPSVTVNESLRSVRVLRLAPSVKSLKTHA